MLCIYGFFDIFWLILVNFDAKSCKYHKKDQPLRKYHPKRCSVGGDPRDPKAYVKRFFVKVQADCTVLYCNHAIFSLRFVFTNLDHFPIMIV